MDVNKARPSGPLDLERIRVVDGAVGTELIRLGWPGDGSPEIWAQHHPDIVTKIHNQYIQAGVEIITAATFGANRACLEHTGCDADVNRLNLELVGLAKQVAGERAYVAGCIGPTGWDAQYGASHADLAQDVFTEQAGALVAAGVDLIAIETMTSLAETVTATKAVASVSSVPMWVCLTFLDSDQLVDGASLAEAVNSLVELGVQAIGCNCMPPDDRLILTVKAMAAVASIPIVVRPSDGLPTVEGRPVENPITPEQFSEFGYRLREVGADIIGGCCGIGPEHIARLCQPAS